MKSRDYEVSLWTIEDEYIATLKHSGAEDKGHLLKPIMQLKTDGTQEFSFSIPLYIYENGQRIENPIWYHTHNGNILINMRKIKVCFHKTDSWQDYRWFEFLITEVKESHKGLQLTCDIKCEGLAFHELGRIGYRISLSPEDFYDDDLKWFKGELENQPHATLQYWMDKVLPVENLSFTRWTYNVQMDWSAYEKGTGTGRKSNKVYEESYIKSYEPSQEIEAFQEKERLIDISESNIYNITQKIAETFGVFCRYDYEHDNNGHIMSRTVVFYNNFMKEKEGYLDFTYPYQTTDLTRTIDSKDLITKMYVRPVDDSTSPSGLITILDVGANWSKEDYIFNFDYLEKIGSFTDWHKSLLQTHQGNLRQINTTISQLANQILIYAEQLPKLKAEVTLHTTALALDKERVATAQDLLNALDVKDGTVDNKISITAQNPRSAILLEDHSSGAATGSYYIKLSDQGIDPSTVKIYKTLDLTQTEVEKRLSNPITTGLAVFDEFNNLEKITNLFKNDGDSSRIFLTYDYTPKLYYDSVVATWQRRMKDDADSLNKAQEKYDAINASLEDAQQQYITALEAKDTLIRNFELALRGLIREGYWQPEDYKDYGDKYQSAWDIDITDGTIQVDSGLTSKYATLLFNGQVLLDDEKDKLGYALGVDQQAISYPWIDLSGIIATENFQKNLEKIVFVCPERIASEQTSDTPVPPSTAQSQSDNFGLVGYRVFSVGSTCEYGLVKKDGKIKPALILTGVKTTDIKDNYLQAGEVGLLTTTSTLNQGLKFTDLSDVVNKIHQDGTYQFLRIKIDSLELKTSSDELAILLNGTTLKEFEDFYITGTADCKYITLKPKTIFKLYHNAENDSYKANHKIKIRYTLSNASTAIYLDAIEVLKENAYPKVSYTINPSIIDERFYLTAYDNLSRIININDPELKFRDVQGYISGLTLDLDAWWQDKIEVKNYKSKFEDLFSTIVASTEAMQKSEYTRGLTAGLFAGTGGDYLSSDIVKTTLRKVDLNYAFNHGTLTIDPENGIWGVSDSGVVAFRGGGIFTATEKDANGGWIWNTGIVPQGINADLIVTGQLDTNKIKVYAGDRVRFQLNSEGLFGYKSFFEDFNALNTEQQGNVISSLAGFLNDSDDKSKTKELLSDDLDPAQYTVFNENGLFLIAKKGAYVLNRDKTAYLKIGQYQQSMDTTNIETGTTSSTLSAKIQAFYADKIDFSQQTGEILNFPEEGVKRVSISWDGLTLRNYNNEKVFFADPDTGDLLLRGNVFAEAFYVLSEVPATQEQGITYTRYPLQQYLTVQFEDHVKVSEELGKIFEKAGEIIKTTLTSLTALETITDENYGILKEFAAKAVDLQADVFTDNNPPANFKPGDIWIPGSAQSNYYNNKYIAMAYSSQVASQIATNPLAGWNKTYDGSLASITGAKMDVDAAAGTIDLYAGSKITLKAKSQLDLSSGDIQITGNNSINIGSKWVNIGSANGGINIISTNIDENSTTDEDGKISNSISKVQIDRNGIIMHSNKIELLAANNNNNVVAISLDPNKGLWIGSDKEIRLFSGAINSSSANVLLNPEKILFGVNSTDSATVAEFTQKYIIFGAAGNSDSETGNVEKLRTDNIPFTGPTAEVTGLKITPNSINLATTSGGTDRAVVSITPLGIQIGTATSDNKGSFVNITQNELVIGSTSNMYINTKNIGLDTTKGVDSEASNDDEDTGFRLGLSDAPSLLFARGNLSVTGAIHASSLFIATGNGEEQSIADYVPKTFYSGTVPSAYKKNDLWINTTDWNTYIAKVDCSGVADENDWELFNRKITGAALTVDASTGRITMMGDDVYIYGQKSLILQASSDNTDAIVALSKAGINMKGASLKFIVNENSNLILDAEQISLKSGDISLTGDTGFIEFKKETTDKKLVPTFRVDKEGNVYCRSIIVEEGGTIGKETTTSSTSAQQTQTITGSFSCGSGWNTKTWKTIENLNLTAGTKYTVLLKFSGTGTSGYFTHFSWSGFGTSFSNRNFPLVVSQGLTLNYNFTPTTDITSTTISFTTELEYESSSINANLTMEIYSNFNSGSSTNSTVTGGWSQGASSNSSSYTVTDKNSGYNLNTVTVTGSWDTNTKKFKVTGTSNNTTSQLLETYVSGAWNTSGTLPVYTIYPEDNNSLNLLTTTLDWGSASTYNNYPSNTYLADGVKNLTTIYGYQSGSTYYVKNSQGTTLFTDSVSATEQYEYRIANFSYVTSNTNASSATSRNKLTTSVQPSAQLQRRLAGTTNAYSLVNTTYGETTDIAIDRQKIKDIYKFLFTAKKIILTRAGTNAIFSVVIDEDGIENTYEYDLEFAASDVGYQSAITRTFA